MLIMTTTLTATSMSTAEQRLRLMQLASSNLPVGGYSWSQGLEWAVEAGWVLDVAAFERWQRRQMTEGFFTVDLPLFARLYRACEQGDIAAAQRWTAYLLACRETRELREEERNRGAAFARLLSDWQPDCPPPWRSLCQQSQLAGMAWLGVRWRIALPEMALSLGYSWIESAVMAGVKLVPFGQQAAQQLILRLCDHYAAEMPRALAPERIVGVETGGCPHTAIREDASMNLAAVEALSEKFGNLDLIFVESGGDNLSATFSPELADLTIYVIDVAEGEKIPRKGGPGITKSDFLVINKTDLAPYVGASLEVMASDTQRMRGDRPWTFTNLKQGDGLSTIIAFLEDKGMLGK